MSGLLSMKKKKTDGFIIYDDHCTLCQQTVRLLNHVDKERQFTFLPFSQTEAKETMDAYDQDRTCLNQVVVIKDKAIYKGADGVLEIMKNLPFPWRQLDLCAYCVPKFMRNKIYTWIANNRS